jgi:hypothetical protein
VAEGRELLPELSDNASNPGIKDNLATDKAAEFGTAVGNIEEEELSGNVVTDSEPLLTPEVILHKRDWEGTPVSSPNKLAPSASNDPLPKYL